MFKHFLQFQTCKQHMNFLSRQPQQKKSVILRVIFYRNYITSIQPKSLSYAADLINSSFCKNIVVITGAGISTPSGIPDFRSAGTGLYDNLDKYQLQQPTDIFDLYFFQKNPYPFFKLAKDLYPGNYQPNYVHYFFKLLSKKKKLLRIYTQNIDGLETLAGVPEEELVEAHGSFRTATCMKCREEYSAEYIKDDIMNGVVPLCATDWCEGVIKPDIVFFGEDLPKRFFLCHQDMYKADVMLVLGTSLEVYPVAGLVFDAPHDLPRILINIDIVAPFDTNRDTDAVYCGDVVKGVKELVAKLQWGDEMNNLMKI